MSTVISYRISEEAKRKLDYLSKITSKTKTELLEEAINLLIIKYEKLGFDIDKRIVERAKRELDRSYRLKNEISEYAKEFIYLVIGLLGAGETVYFYEYNHTIKCSDSYYQRRLESIHKKLMRALENWDLTKAIIIHKELMYFVNFCVRILKLYEKDSPTKVINNFRVLFDLTDEDVKHLLTYLLNLKEEKLSDTSLEDLLRMLDKSSKREVLGRLFLLCKKMAETLIENIDQLLEGTWIWVLLKGKFRKILNDLKNG